MIEELTLQRFKSYRIRQTARFTLGVNKISGRNASGKTTLLEAVLFGLFGDVPGVNKRDLVSLGGGGMSVSLTFTSPLTGQRGKILREGSTTTRRGVEEGFRSSKIIMEVEGEEHPYTRERDVQAKIKELLGVGKSVFTNVVYARQKEFIEILNPHRARMDAVLGLATPTEIREQLREVKRLLEDRGGIRERGAIEERIRICGESLEKCTRELVEVQNRKTELSKGLEKKRLELKVLQGRTQTIVKLSEDFGKLDKLTAELVTLKRLKEQRVQDIQVYYKELGQGPDQRRAELQAGLRSAQATEERLNQLLDEDLGRERRNYVGDMARLNHMIGDHTELKDQGVTICPKCGQEIDFELIKDDLEKWTEELEEKKRLLSILEMEIKEIRKQATKARERRFQAENELTKLGILERRIKELSSAIEGLDSKIQGLSHEVNMEEEELLLVTGKELVSVFSSLEEARAKIEDILESKREESSTIVKEVGRLEGLLRELKRREGGIEDEVNRYERTLEGSSKLMERILEYEAKIGAIDNILRLYGEYEQQLRENTLRLLEYHTYNYFRRLTDQQIYSACHIDRERYTMEVQPLGSSRTLPAWRTGGGHESLFALAERLALLKVMSFPYMLILDEPTDAVDSENVPQLLEYIARSGREIGQVLLVTHHGHGEEEGVNLIRVRKVKGESRIYQELGET